MLKKDIILQGLKLALELEQLSKQYHVKSDKHEILGYEAHAIRGMAEEISRGDKPSFELLESTLLSDWGSQLSNELPDAFTRVKAFRQEYTVLKTLSNDKKSN